MEQVGVTEFSVGDLRCIRQSAVARAKAISEKPSETKVFDHKPTRLLSDAVGTTSPTRPGALASE
ncbi:MAG: hypothetical protein ACYDEY_09365 [Acidimicrobiales bacterium]